MNVNRTNTDNSEAKRAGGTRLHKNARCAWAAVCSGANDTFVHWLLALFFRVSLVFAILVGLIGSRGSVSEVVTGEVIETVEVVVSFHSRHHESDSFFESDREFSRRKCVRHCGRNANVVRCCCCCLNNRFQNRHLSVGHRRPDNSLAPLLI